MNNKPAVPRAVDEYIAGFPADVQDRLQQIRSAIRSALPKAGETISYGMPTVTLDGRSLIGYAAYKGHIGMYPAPTGVPEFAAAIAPYLSSKATLRFPHDQPLPLALIRRIVKFQAKQKR